MNLPESFRQNLDLTSLSEKEIDEAGDSVMDNDDHSLKEWFKQRGYDIDAKLYYPTFGGGPTHRAEIIRRVFEVINKVGLDKLQGKSFLLVPDSKQAGYFQHPIYKEQERLTLGLNAATDTLVDAINRFVVEGESKN